MCLRWVDYARYMDTETSPLLDVINWEHLCSNEYGSSVFSLIDLSLALGRRIWFLAV